jgi:hypothetical protein
MERESFIDMFNLCDFKRGTRPEIETSRTWVALGKVREFSWEIPWIAGGRQTFSRGTNCFVYGIWK